MSVFNYRKRRNRWISGLGSMRPSSGVKRSGKHHSRRQRMQIRKRWKMVGIGALAVFLILICVGAGAFYYLRFSGERSLLESAEVVPELGNEEGLVYRNGKKYRYNDGIVTLLFMGIDTDSDLSEVKEVSGSSGQADTIFLMVMNPDTESIRVIGISRDTMTEIQTFDYYGNYIGDSVNHLGLAYAFGDGNKKSGELMMDAVSRLFYGLPIHGYCAVNLNAISTLNNVVGGVYVTMPSEMTLAGKTYGAGQNVLLVGAEAESFVRQRDTEAAGSNNERMARQKQYALSFFRSAVAAVRKNLSLPATMYRELSKEMVTSLNVNQVVYLASEIVGMSLDIDRIQMLEGSIKQGAVYEEFYVDEDALQDLIIDTFYKEVE